MNMPRHTRVHLLVILLALLSVVRCRSPHVEEPPNWYSRAARAMDQAGDLPHALLLLEGAEGDEAAATWVTAYRAAIEVRKENAARSLAELRQKLSRVRRPRTRAQTMFKAGVCLELLGQAEQALASYRQSIEIWPDHAAVFLRRGLLLERQGDLAAAESDLRHALALEPASAVAHLHLGRFLVEHGLGNREERAALMKVLESSQPLYADMLRRVPRWNAGGRQVENRPPGRSP